jgi:hypothetical protein
MRSLEAPLGGRDPQIAGISNCVGDIGTHVENFVHYFPGVEDGVAGVKFVHAVIESAANDSKWVEL